jgi:hypothetical protein
MNRKALWIVLLTLGLTYVAGCGSSSNNNDILVSISQAPPGILAPGAPAVSITATVTGDSAHAGVTWSCTPGNSAATCGSFNPATTPSGTATMYSPPASAVGAVTIIATSVTNSAAFATANVSISTSGGLAGNFSFYLSGLDFNFNSYSLAGAVTIAADGTLTGEQDFNNTTGDNSPAGGDMIMAGSSLSFDPTTGLGMLNLQTNNHNLGTNGTETLELNFVNNSHALIIQADGFATSSGSFDLQNFSTPLANEGFSFVLSGAHDASGETFIYGGVFTLSGGTSLTNGTMDSNDGHGGITLGHSFGGTLIATDTFGRGTGTLTNTVGGLASSIAYYVVGPEAIRIIDKDSADTAVGSAFGQGSGTFTNSSLLTSILSVQSNSAGFPFTALGQITPSGADAVPAGTVGTETSGPVVTNDFTGIADVNETPDSGLDPFFLDATAISGTYFIQSNGYGGLTIGSADNDQLLDVADLGIYMVNPNININDPNNSSGGGGALVADLDVNLAGSGAVVPQTSNSTLSFAGNYAFGLQDFAPGLGEFDIVGNATATTSLTGSGVVSDPTDVLNGASAVESGTFSSPIAPDTTNSAGRYLMDTFTVDVADGTSTIDYGAIVYQASGGQLFWMENGGDAINSDSAGSVFSGQLQQQTLPLGGDAKKAAAKTTQKQ